jgi:hypothetical protein
MLVDSSTGLGKTGLTYSDMTGSYTRTRSARVAVSMVTQTVTGAFASGGFVEIDATNQPGLYRWDHPDAGYVTGADSVVFSLKANGVRTEHKEFRLVNVNNQVAYVPNAAADAAGGLPISDTGGLDMDAMAADVAGLDGESMRGTDGANTTAPDNTQGATVITALGNGTVVLHSDYDAAKDAASQTSVNDMPTNAEFEARTLATADYGTATNQTTLLDRLTASRAGYLDNLNVGGAVASNADILALNQSASRRILLTTVGQYERPESGSTVYTIEARTFDGDGVATNADSSPTLTGTGQTTGSLAANIGTISNPATGVYRWEYTVASGATIEPARFDVSATIGGSPFTLSVYTQVVDFVSATWTSGDASKLTTLYDDWANGGRLDNILDARASQTSVDDIPTNSELAIALAAADDATLAAIAALNFATPTNVTDAQTAIIAQVDANEVKIDNIQTSVNIIDGIVDNILIDTNELQTDNVPGLISALNNIAATDIVSAGPITTLSGAVVNVDLVDVTTTNSDMRGTDGANTVAPDNSSITAIKAKTDNLPSDPSSSTNITNSQTAIIAQVDANEVKIDNIQTSINTIDGIVDNILIDTNELQVDWTNGGRLDSIIDLILADTGTDGIVISSTTANQIADAILTRDWTLVSGEAARSALNALRILRNKVSESGGTLTITEEDDSTTAWTASVTTSVSANPITIIDPS